MPKKPGNIDLNENRDHRFLIDDKMRIVDGLSEPEYQRAVGDKRWVKKNLQSGRVFLSELPNEDVPNTADRERALWEKYRREHPGHRVGGKAWINQHLAKPGLTARSTLLNRNIRDGNRNTRDGKR